MTPEYLKALCDLRIAEDVDLDLKRGDPYATTGLTALLSCSEACLSLNKALGTDRQLRT